MTLKMDHAEIRSVLSDYLGTGISVTGGPSRA